MSLIRRADVLVEGFRPGVMERLGYGPEDVQAAQPPVDLRADDRLGSDPVRGRNERATTSTTSV